MRKRGKKVTEGKKANVLKLLEDYSVDYVARNQGISLSAVRKIKRDARRKEEQKRLEEVRALFKDQLFVPSPEAIQIDNFGQPGRHTIPLRQEQAESIIRVTWGNSTKDATVFNVIKESWNEAEVQINVAVLPDYTMELFCPVEEKPLFPELFSSLSETAREQFTAWKQRGGDYLTRCAAVRWEIDADVTEGASRLIYQAARNFPESFSTPLDDLLAPDFVNLVYHRSVIRQRSSGIVDIPSRKLYRIRRQSPTFCELYLGPKRLAKAPYPSPFRPALEIEFQLLKSLAELHRDKIIKWSAAAPVAEILELYEGLRGIEAAIKEELEHLWKREMRSG